ncbi:hypothetical protein COU62_04210 [Candidatus Pacearchaeota archaeon CG10_big_fil_rev_8_21_14_0_10_35_219]|nr:hypothetical protein [Candidatus Pacearchaeota archaeon]OIO42217.1 MAG: hypothetical protein AUJ63_02960 [Candidatus Pacearchaeota archaeon CG1_02_35_32]PIO07314.1 MAG: hypothetical protein COU62_04210 [Candidatus Pacearchaeota archaeon CG10_big_fil_rev_8_21_14_0_10_35_219]PIY81364.1 MAG: hypothetical protein COY79_03755 [Candidatus Pacearchaeota archaeon CG_4_10_14_0_8_um_filter_35_169]PIZ79820.1 MAG: hypothetical protein COY00_03260 [Candidatus Pacearchaeota archaeon CG_4_10_14_0_2_um_filt
MAKVIISEKLEAEINKKFKKESVRVFNLLYSLEKNPKKGKFLGNIGKIALKELRYKVFRFYFITDGFKLKVLDESVLTDLLIKVVRMSDKKDQQKTIDEVKDILKRFGERGF